MKRLRHLLCLASFVVLAACGGGGGNDDADTVPISGNVVDTDGQAIANVTVTLGDATAQTDASGRFTLQVPAESPAAGDAPAVISFRKTGYAQQMRRTAYAANAAQRVNAVMRTVGATLSFDPAQPQHLAVSGSTAAVILPAGALQRSDGSAPAGQVTAQLTPIDPGTDPMLMPGRMGESDDEPIESFGALQVSFTDSAGQALNLAAGQTATVRIPAVSRGTAAPATVPLYYLDESSGYWVAEGSATLTGSAPNAYYQGSVTHFSTWNADQLYDTVYVNGCVRNASGTAVSTGLVLGSGVDYIGNSFAALDGEGRFRLPVKRHATTRVLAEAFSPLVHSAPLDVTVAGVDVTLDTCLVLDQDGVPPPVGFPGDDDDDDDDTPAAFAGNYAGSFTGAETGSWSVTIATSGAITGSGTSTSTGSFSIGGDVTGGGDVTLNATAGSAGIAQFTGSINAQTGAVSGTWRYTGSTSDAGTFSGQRQ